MSIVKKTVVTTEVTVPGDRPGQWVTKTTQTTTTEQVFPPGEWPGGGRFGLPEGMTEVEDEELPPL